MKLKTTLAVIFFFSSFTIANAQIKKGSILLGGLVAVYNAETNTSGLTRTQVDREAIFYVNAGKAIKENTFWGINASYSPFSLKNYNFYNNVANIDSRQYSAGIFYRKYRKLLKDFYFTAEAGLAYTGATQNSTDSFGVNKEHVTENGARLSFVPGLSYRVFKKLHVELTMPGLFSVGYAARRTKTPTGGSNTNIVQFNTALLPGNSLGYLGIGFHFIL